MIPSRRIHLARRARWALAAAAAALHLVGTVPASATGFSEARGIRGIFAALQSDPWTVAPSFVPKGAGLRLCVVDLEPAGIRDSLNLGLGKCWNHRTALRHFLGFGARFPFPDSTGLSDEEGDGKTRLEGDEAGDLDLSVGAWIGGGSVWYPSQRLHLSFGVQWIPGKLSLSGSQESGPQVRALWTAGFLW